MLVERKRNDLQKRIANHIRISKERVNFIIKQFGYRKICTRWVPRRLKDENSVDWNAAKPEV